MSNKNKEINKKLLTQVNLTVSTEVTYEELIWMISEVVKKDDAAEFIALLAEDYADWDVDVALIQHFEAIKEIYLKEPQEKDEDLSPKNLIE